MKVNIYEFREEKWRREFLKEGITLIILTIIIMTIMRDH